MGPEWAHGPNPFRPHQPTAYLSFGTSTEEVANPFPGGRRPPVQSSGRVKRDKVENAYRATYVPLKNFPEMKFSEIF